MGIAKCKKGAAACALAVAMIMSSIAGSGDIRTAMAQNNEDAAGGRTDSSNESFENYDVKLLTIDDEEISTKSNGEKVTVLVFGRTTCGNTRATISDLAKSELTKSDEFRVIYADIDGTAKEDVQKFASVYGNEYINFCYDSAGSILPSLMWEYARAVGISGSVTLPVTVLVDENDQVQKVMTGVQRMPDLLAEIDKFAELSYSEKTDHSSEPNVASKEPQPSATQSPGEVPGGNSSVNPAHLGFTKRTEGGQISENVGRHDYVFFCSRGVFSYLEQNKDGTYERVEACGDEIVVESYSGNFQLTGTKKIEKPLTAFGGYFSGESYKFIVFEQGNPNEDDSLEVLRVVKYDKDWNELDHCSISGINTTVPSDAGSLRMTETDGMLYIHTCHEMYKSSDGLNHQANMSFAIDQQSMTVTQKQCAVSGVFEGYVSHSFNQFIVTDGAMIYRLDHGDAHPRAVVISKCNKDDIKACSDTEVLSIRGEIGENLTGVSVGGFNMCGGNLVTVGNSVEQSDWTYYPGNQRNVFVAVTDKEPIGTSINWLTDYQEGEYIEIGNPYLIPCSDGAYVMWEEKKSNEDEPLTKLVKLDKSGNKIGETHTIYARLSDCQPILTSEGQLVWYTTFGGAPVFYCLDTGRLAEYEHRGWGKMADCTVTLSQDTYEYSGAAGPYEPIPVVRYGDLLLEEGRDYTILYRNNNTSGTATVVIKGHGFFEGEKEVAFTIAAPKPQATAAPKATVKPKKKTTSTTTSVRNRRTSYRTATRYPGKVGGVKAKNNSRRALKINWKKTKNADYYEIQIARNRAFTRGKKKDTSYVRGTSFFRLKKNATYYVRVRAIGYSNGRNRYGTWSAVKKVKVRK